MTPTSAAQHVFLSYVHEDQEVVARIQKVLEAANIPVWRDRDSLWPGEDWKLKIREAIQAGSFAFIAFFSENSVARDKSYQNEELVLAVEQLRLRTPDRAWLIPVRLSDCEPPDYDLGGGRTLRSLQRVDLFGDTWDTELGRLVASVLHILGSIDGPGKRAANREIIALEDLRVHMKAVLLDPAKQIELEDRVNGQLDQVVAALSDAEMFPVQSANLTNDNDGLRFAVGQVDKYRGAVAPLLDVLAVGCTYGEPRHEPVWARTIEAVANTATRGSGQTALIDLRRYPMMLLLYVGAIAAVQRKNFGALRAITTDARFRNENAALPLIAGAHVWRAFRHSETVAQLIAFQVDTELTDDLVTGLVAGRVGKRYTPINDHLHAMAREPLREFIRDDREYTEVFDRTEVLLGLIASDVELQLKSTGQYSDGPWFGSFTWRDRWSHTKLEETIQAEFRASAGAWPPLQGGLFGGDPGRAELAFAAFLPEAAQARSRR